MATWKSYLDIQRRHNGTSVRKSLDFARLLLPAIEYARNGYPIYARVRYDWLEAASLLAAREASRAVFLPNGRVPEEGDIHHQPR